MRRGMFPVLFFVSLALSLAAYEVKADCLADACYKHSINKAFPEARADMQSGKLANPKKLAANIGKKSRSSYGFASGISKEKGSFILGVLLTDLNVLIAANEMESAAVVTGALAEDFKNLQAPPSLIESAAKVNEAVAIGAGKKEMDMIMPVVEPFIFDYVSREGKDIYMKLGFWVETARLFLDQGDTETAIAFLKSQMGAFGALYFNEALKRDDLPKGVKNSLNVLTEISVKEKIGSRESAAALTAVNTIYQLMI